MPEVVCLGQAREVKPRLDVLGEVGELLGGDLPEEVRGEVGRPVGPTHDRDPIASSIPVALVSAARARGGLWHRLRMACLAWAPRSGSHLCPAHLAVAMYS